ncbi:hypothetical protein BM613_11580 [Sulfoacidibacillus thermotolerans]|uniref:Uncharacterized protein n=1 Tax=Sulfoacidibacillus thermotolerans TaxID=1765684 RepID=A0A2U3D6H0_SULT2|nr:hypothetical protein BM613_11580 [Sulfoacidibacillus thermotolerans]
MKITYQFFTPATESPKHSGVHKPLVTTFQAPSFGVAENIANVSSDRMITSQQLKVTIISESFAKKNDVARVLEGMVRSRSYRRDILLVTSLDDASDTIRANLSKLGSTSLDFIENMRNQHTFTGFLPVETLNDFLIANESGDTLAFTGLVALNKQSSSGESTNQSENRIAGQFPIKNGDDPLQYIGAEIYRGDRAAGRLTGQETRIVLLLQRKIGTFLMELPDIHHSDRRNTLLLRQIIGPRIRAHLDHGQLHFIIHVPLDATLDSTTAEINYVQDTKQRRLLERVFDQKLQHETVKLLHRCQKEFRGDPIGLYPAIKWRFLTEKSWRQFNYTKHFNKARFIVQYEIEITNFGKQRAPFGAQ